MKLTKGAQRGMLASGLAVLVLVSASCSFGDVTTSRHALVYGISLYASGDEGDYPNLTYTDDDAVSMAALLAQNGWDDVRPKIKGYNSTTDQLPTKANILSDISSLSTVDSSDTVLIYYSGHGYYDGNRWYIIPSDGFTPGGFQDPANWITPSELSQYLDALPTDKVIVILDSCNSGGFVTTDMEIDTAPQDYGPYDDGTAKSTIGTAMSRFGELLVMNAASKGIPEPIVLSAAGSEEESWEQGNPYNHGFFTYFLIESASTGSLGSDGYVTTTEAYSYASAGIKSYWNVDNYYNGDDYLPHISGGSRDLVLFDKN